MSGSTPRTSSTSAGTAVLSDAAADLADQPAGRRLIGTEPEAGELLDFDQRALVELLGCNTAHAQRDDT